MDGSVHYNQTLSSEIDRSPRLIFILRLVELKFYSNDENLGNIDANKDRNVPNYSLPARCICSIRTPPSKRLPFPIDVDTRVDTPGIEAFIQF